MRSSKPRSRNKPNRSRSIGNVINRVFDSSGPEGKVRGTPQQVIDKYTQLARDAQLSGDRVAAENFQQHAEHYLRLLSAAQKEQDSRREEQERQNRERQVERDRDRDRGRRQERESNGGDLVADDARPDVLDASGDSGGSGLVETPENRVSREQPTPETAEKSGRRKPRGKPRPAGGGGANGDGNGTPPREAAE